MRQSFIATLIMLLSITTVVDAKDFPNDAVRKGAADIVFTNGNIYTVDNKSPFAEAVAVKGGRFVEVGSTKDIEKFVGNRTRVVDLGGAFAIPGFIDDHIHPAHPYLHQEGGALLFPESFNKQQRQITAPLEQAIGGLPGLVEVRSISKFGLSQVTVTFEDGTDVYLARHTGLQRAVAVQFLNIRESDDPKRLANLQRHIRLVSTLIHPNILPVHEFGIVDERPYIVTDYVPGVSLAAYMTAMHAAHSSIRLDALGILAEALSGGLQYAHERGLFHGDINPSNIRLTSPSAPIQPGKVLPADVKALLTDLGMAQFNPAGLTESPFRSPEHILTRSFLGSSKLHFQTISRSSSNNMVNLPQH